MTKQKSKLTISIIAAIGPNRELGKDNQLLWHIPKDLKRFKKLTEGHAVIMGRKTFESLGRPLPNRLNIVITRSKPKTRGQNFICTRISPSPSAGSLSKAKKFFPLVFLNSIEEAISFVKNLRSTIYDLRSKNELFIIGGGQIYRQALPLADKLYLTVVEATPEHPDGRFAADTFFPEYKNIFKRKIFEEKHEEKGYRYIFIDFIR